LSLEHLKKLSKKLHKSVQDAQPAACQRVRTVFDDYTGKPDDELSATVPLMRVQHVVAREHGFKSWDDLRAATPEQLFAAIGRQRTV
jgi:hypothetical protein